MHEYTIILTFLYTNFRYRQTQRKSRHERNSSSRRLKNEMPLKDISMTECAAYGMHQPHPPSHYNDLHKPTGEPEYEEIKT